MSLLDTASLIVTPNAYKEGKLYSVIPSDGSGDMSVTRATTATRVNSAGLVELVPYNLLTYSQEFDNVAWVKAALGGTALTTVVTPNSATAPDGTLTADKIFMSLGGGTTTSDWARLQSQTFNQTSGTSYTISFWAWASQSSEVGKVVRVGIGGNTALLDFTLTATATRFTVTYTASATGTDSLLFQLRGAQGLASTAEFYLWGAQLNEGTLKDYQKTETRLNIPRLDYSNSTCPSLLVEPQRTNVVLQSSSFDSTTWQKGPFNTIVANAIISPDGTQNADKIESIGGGGQVRYTNQSISTTIGTYSIYMKAGELTECLMYGAGAGDGIYWNLTDGSFIGYYAGGSNITSYSSEDVGNGWYRYTMTNTNSLSYAEIYMTINQVIGANIPNGQGFYLWGAQVEVGSYATSYIPTTSASVTRNADVISKTGISSLIGQTEGVMFIDYNYDAKPDTNGNLPMVIYDGSNEAYIFITGGGSVRLELYNGGVLQGSIAGSIGAVGRKKIAFGYKQNDFVGYMNGVQIATDNNGTVGAMSNLYVGSYYTASYNANGGINAAALWKTRLTNTQLAQLTTI